MTEPDLLTAWTSLAGDGVASRGVWDDLIGRWSEPHRKYHNVAHLAAIVGLVDKYAQYADDLLAVELAAWFHDAVYDPRSATNEADSAALAGDKLTSLGFAPAIVSEVARLIMTTASHDGDDPDAALLADADLAVLGSPAEAYIAYVNAIREEYSHVSDADFRTGRSAILQDFVDRDQIYLLEPIRNEFEQQARRNITAELLRYK
jgi:predicted metal-dependent HD superfamily phosphohydrolase